MIGLRVESYEKSEAPHQCYDPAGVGCYVLNGLLGVS
jgi:hypothetical protein